MSKGKLDLKMSLLHRGNDSSNRQVSSPETSVSSVEMSPGESSCVSSETEETITCSSRSSPDKEGTAMLLVGCTRCLMYLLLPRVDPKCPRCKSTVLLDFLNEDDTPRRRQVRS